MGAVALTAGDWLMLAVQLVLLGGGCWALFRQWRAARGPEETAVWRTDFGSVTLLVFLVIGGFLVVSTVGQLPFFSAEEKLSEDGTALVVRKVSTEGIFFATLCAHAFAAGLTVFLMRRLQPDFSFNFPRIQRKADRAWNGRTSFLAAVAVVTGGSLLFWAGIQILEHYGIVWDLENQLPVELLLAARENPWALLAAFVSVVICAPVAEEIFFRGCLYRYAKGVLGRWGAMVAVGAIFALIHANLAVLLPLTFLGAYLCLVYERSGDIRTPIVVHALFNLNSFLCLLLAPNLSKLMSP